MNRIDRIFRELRSDGGKALMPFVTAGYPTLEATAAILPALESNGAHICELGIPFSDPIADGPVIEASMTEALGRGLRVPDVFEAVQQVRDRVSLGIVAMMSFSIMHRMGVQQTIQRAAESGFDGFILPDLPVDEADRTTDLVRDAGLTCSLLIAPTTSPQRAERIAAACSGFVYVVARTGITGERDRMPEDLTARVEQLRTVTDLPIAVGFGISRAEHVRAVTSVADAAIVGSALVRVIGDHRSEGVSAIASAAGRFVGELATGLT